MKVLAKPAFSNKSQNPYNYLLYNRLEKIGNCKVEEFEPWKAVIFRYDIFHMHWPEVMLSKHGLFFSVVTVNIFLLLIKWMKLRDTRIVWTVHNVNSHDYPYKSWREQKFEKWYMRKFTELLDGAIGLSGASLKKATEAYPVLSAKQSAVIPHGHYKDVYPDEVSKKIARSQLDIGYNKFLISFFGQIRPYKNVFQLIRAYQALDDNIDLLIAGNPVHSSLENEIRRLSGNFDGISLMLKFIPNEELQYIFKATDLVVIPYQKVLNSGSVLLSLSYDTPVLVPDCGSMLELQHQLGECWVQVYSNDLTSGDLEKAVEVVKTKTQARCKAIDQFGWDRIARMTAQAYQQFIERDDA